MEAIMTEKGSIEQVGEQDSSKKNSPILDQSEEEKSQAVAAAGTLCWFNGQQYGPGAEICSGGTRLRCHPDGSWVRIGTC